MAFRPLSRDLLLSTVCIVALAWGCSGDAGSSNEATGGAVSSAGSASAAAGSGAVAGAGTSSGGAGAMSELPCDVQKLVATKCQLCHKIDPPGTLLTSADFRRPSKADPAKSVGTLALERLEITTNLRMPPPPLEPATAAEIAALSAWIKGGAMPTGCADGTPVAPDPYDTPVVCTSMKNWTGGNRESPLMRPGGACISCHRKEGEGPLFAVSGTLFPTPHEPDDCNGVNNTIGAQVVITEASGKSHTLDVNAAGNFYLEASGFAYPYQAKVVYQGRERVMVEAQTSGDCNDCHTQAGRENAPGRIFLP